MCTSAVHSTSHPLGCPCAGMCCPASVVEQIKSSCKSELDLGGGSMGESGEQDTKCQAAAWMQLAFGPKAVEEPGSKARWTGTAGGVSVAQSNMNSRLQQPAVVELNMSSTFSHKLLKVSGL